MCEAPRCVRIPPVSGSAMLLGVQGGCMFQRLMGGAFVGWVCLLAGCEPVEDPDVPDSQVSVDVAASQDLAISPDGAARAIDAQTQSDVGRGQQDIGPDAHASEDATVDVGRGILPDVRVPIADAQVIPDANPLDGGDITVPDLGAPVIPDAAPMVPDAAPVMADAAPAPIDAAPAMADAAPPVPDAMGADGGMAADGAVPGDVEDCGPNGFFCPQSRHCIPLRWLCDHGGDCEPFGEDDSDEICSVHPLPDRCFVDQFGFRDELICYPGCWDGQRCEAHENCVMTRVGEACIPDCRRAGCPDTLICGEDGRCDQDPNILIIGAECESDEACLGRPCCVPTILEPEKLMDPPVRICLTLEDAAEMNPNGQGRCLGSCETCVSMPGTQWCYRGNCFGSCEDLNRGAAWNQWERDVLDLGHCISDQDYCWAGFCECLDSQTGLCLEPAN